MNSNKIKGIPLCDSEIRISQYADDTNLFSMYDKSSLDGIVEIFDIIEKNMGLKVNYDKTNIYRKGSIKNSLAKLYTQRNFRWESAPINVLGVDIAHCEHLVIKRNYDHVLENVKEVLNLWVTRDLSLMGKVLVVNTSSLIASHFVYKLSALRSPTKDQLEEFNKLIVNYIWNSRQPKVKSEILKGKKDQGGLKLVDMQKKDISLKIQWVNRILKNDDLCTKLAYYFLPKVGSLIWKCNLHKNDIDNLMPRESFWKDVLFAWCSISFKSPVNLDEIKNTILWYNSEIRIENKPVFYKKCHNNGMTCIRDILNENKSFMSYPEIVTKFGNVITFTQYYGILEAIPVIWKRTIRNDQGDHIDVSSSFFEYFKKKLTCTSAIYNYLIDSPYLVNEQKVKWENNLQKPMDNKFFCSLFENIKGITLCTKLRSFQYRLLNNAILTNKRLFKMKEVPTEYCTFCNMQVETVVHVLWECTTAQHLWNNVRQWVSQKTGKNVIFTLDNVILNNVTKNPIDSVNMICLIVKQYIYSSRCLKAIPNFQNLKQKIIEYHNMEKYLAKSKGILEKHNKKWKNLIERKK